MIILEEKKFKSEKQCVKNHSNYVGLYGLNALNQKKNMDDRLHGWIIYREIMWVMIRQTEGRENLIHTSWGTSWSNMAAVVKSPTYREKNPQYTVFIRWHT